MGVPFGADPERAVFTDAAGVATFAVDSKRVPVERGLFEAVLPGQTWTFQVLYSDAGASLTTNALALAFR